MTSAEIRQQFLDFFASKKHQIVASAPIVVKNDPTLLFTNAGMNQFKDYFLGNKKPEFSRIADTQKCLRVSGKHNDLEEVGVDTYHHTMFEMLGNWSFGDYFKSEAIAWSWELLTEVYKLDKDRLYVTVFEGDEKEGLPASSIALAEWKKLVAEDHIVFGNKKDNFWEMGDTGPCGPCTEIHVDCRPEEERKLINGNTLVNKDHPQVIEIWNNVFMQYNRLKEGKLVPLPARHVDTGMGFERLVRVIQGKQSNYDTDVFTGTIAATEKITGKKYDQSDSKEAIAFRVLADHIRAIGFTIADGQLPANTGAGYVIRRILRRAVRYYYSYLDYKQPLLFQLIPIIAAQFKTVFPELNKQQDFVSKVVKEEEDAFLRTLDKGLKRMDDIIKQTNNAVIDGKAAFELFDTFGFPVDLTRLIATENNLSIDEAGFESEMQQQKNRSRAASILDTEDWIEVSAEAGEGFVGYKDILVTSRITKYRKISAKGKTQFQLVLNTTPFYAESGGQVGDTGWLEFGDTTIEVTDTKKENDLIVHFVNELPNEINGNLTARIDVEKRLFTCYNHTATHLLHAALRKVLGIHVAQKGSLVNEDSLRFDFSHFARVTDEEIRQIEKMVNDKIRENLPVVITEMPKEEALKIGAMALFGEKYGNTVRVVVVDPNYSVELCGGTHVMHTGMIGIFKITAESAVAAGVRRIEALTGGKAFNYLYEQFAGLKEVAGLLKTQDPLRAVEKIIAEKQELEKKVESLEAKQLESIKDFLLGERVSFSLAENKPAYFIGKIVDVSNADHLKKLSFSLKSELGENYMVVLCANIAGKAAVSILLSDSIVSEKGLEAPKIIKEQVAPLIKGGGGGQKTLATAGGQDASNLQQVIDSIQQLIN
jgi:alanyl-tRNA synthetase